jgi:hypothetical protein
MIGGMFHKTNIEGEWREENLPPFDELILSWNGRREGQYHFYVSVKVKKWSEWLLYASWGVEGQRSYAGETSLARVYQDALIVQGGEKASGFRINVIGREKPPLTLHVYTNGAKEEKKVSLDSSILLPVRGLSQITLNHPRFKDLCSPTSTTAVVRYLLNRDDVDPIHFAQNAHDQGFDIYGNWVLNTAEASHHLGAKWNVWVERLSGFADIIEQLLKKTPVIVSVRGPLKGSALPYAHGHLMTVIGFDPATQKVSCIDPAFESDEKSKTEYFLSNFLEAWNRRGKIAYVFTSSS